MLRIYLNDMISESLLRVKTTLEPLTLIENLPNTVAHQHDKAMMIVCHAQKVLSRNGGEAKPTAHL
jgi:hypothetical protein